MTQTFPNTVTFELKFGEQGLLQSVLTFLSDMQQQRDSYVQCFLKLLKCAFGDQNSGNYNMAMHSDKEPSAKLIRRNNELVSF